MSTSATGPESHMGFNWTDPAWEITDTATGRSLGAWRGATPGAALDAWVDEEGYESWAAAVAAGRAPARVAVAQYDDGPQ